MAIDLTGIQNENEFYSDHYLTTVFEGDIKVRLAAGIKKTKIPDQLPMRSWRDLQHHSSGLPLSTRSRVIQPNERQFSVGLHMISY
jgi:hypothetical protein